MPSLDALAGWEAAVVASIRGASGTLEERDRQITRSGLYAEYPVILRGYIEHFGEEATGLEALKRAVFVVWYGTAEPAPLTGIAELPEPDAREVMTTLESRARRGRLDDELRWMLAWYHDVLPVAFTLFGADVQVPAVAASMPADEWRRRVLETNRFARRGQLGDYWTSLLQGERA